MQDFYQKEIYNSLCPNSICEGDYWSIPEGIISYTSMSMDPSQFSNRFKKIQHNKIDIETGELTSVISNVNEIKLSFSFDIEIICNTTIETMKVWEAFLNVFYKVGQFEFNYNGIIVYCNVGWQENTQLQNTYEFSFASEKENKLLLSLEVETDYPIFDISNEEPLYKQGTKYTIKIKNTERLQEIMEFWICQYGLEDGDCEVLTGDLETDFKIMVECLIKKGLYNEHHTSQNLGFDIRRYFEVITKNEYKDNVIETFVIRINRDSKDFSVQKHIRDTNISYGDRQGKAIIEEQNVKQSEHIITKNTLKQNEISMMTMISKVEIDGLETDQGLVTNQLE